MPSDRFKEERTTEKAFIAGRKMGEQRLDALVEFYSNNYSSEERKKIEKQSKEMNSRIMSMIRKKIGYTDVQSLSFYLGYFTGRYFPSL